MGEAGETPAPGWVKMVKRGGPFGVFTKSEHIVPADDAQRIDELRGSGHELEHYSTSLGKIIKQNNKPPSKK
jgi:hypothetical protein